MAVPIARKTLLYEWRRFLPAVAAVAFSGLLMTAQGALLLGIVSANSLYVSQSDANYWVGFPGTQSVELGRTVKVGVLMSLYSEPLVSHIEPLLLGSGDWRATGGNGGVSVTVVGVETQADSVGLARVVPAELRNQLREPGAVVVDASDSDKLSTRPGDLAEVNGHTVRVIGLIDGLRGLGGVNVVSSLDTARMLDPTLPDDGAATYFLFNVKAGSDPSAVIARLNRRASVERFEIWPSGQLASMSTNYMLFDSGAGIAFIFATLIAATIGALITSQTLMAAVAGALPQYATLRALGVPFGGLRTIVAEQAAWVGISGLIISGGLSLLIALIAQLYKVPFVLDGVVVLLASLVVLVVAILACLLAIHRLRQADPASLLR
ncbi:ABC transporter permease [Rhizobium sp. P40RR-XXII]|uniref:ABC transporter permease n=1 Tax=unclassified Rhizobium TaxID=2613769 RepID=UPI0014571705|nr:MULTISPECIES: FtsX-like permease family protein [unclassified Rhizobium]NLR86116.1 ABC transporter permease [Rhizobium sp. P28RR-XV]NLS18729.1 ABC transporter permease [Rhizobium sp. P40RR-XXII]